MWEQIRSNRRRTAFVVAGMGVLLVVVGMAAAALFTTEPGGLVVGGAVALAVWLVLWIVSVQGGDDIMLRMAGAREIRHEDHPVLFNVVEEMTVAARLPKRPRIYVVDDPSPNAFATGRSPEKASVAVTTGLLRLLDRDELQGVVAHEIGHVKNRDVALVTTAGIMVGSIVLLADIGMRSFLYSGGGMRRSRSSGSRDGGQGLVMVVAIVLLILSPLLAQLLYFALSRRREYLADASGAMFTRFPEGLASALEKLGGSREPLGDTSRVTAPMYIVRPLKEGEKRSLDSAFATHPPLAARIRILRSMGSRADPAAYDAAFQRVRGRRIVGTHTLEESTALGIREPAPAEGDGTAVRAARAREASDAFLAASGYAMRRCTACGARVKVPPTLAGRVRRCPRCQGDLAEHGE